MEITEFECQQTSLLFALLAFFSYQGLMQQRPNVAMYRKPAVVDLTSDRYSVSSRAEF